MFVSRLIPNPPPPTTATSPDRRLKATAAEYGVALVADFGAIPEQLVATNLWPHPFWSADDTPTVNATSNRWGVYAEAGGTYTLGPGTVHQGRTMVRMTNTGPTTNRRLGLINNSTGAVATRPNIPAGTTFWFGVDVQLSADALANAAGLQVLFRDDVAGDSLAATVEGNSAGTVSDAQVIPKGQVTRIWWKATVKAARTITRIYLSTLASAAQPAGAFLEAGRYQVAVVQPGETEPPEPFDGDDAAAAGYDYRYTGTAQLSPSEKFIPGLPSLETDPQNPILTVEFVRKPDIPVRSGDPARAPSGRAHAFDMEVPAGVGAVWYAYPVFHDGTTGAPSEGVQLVSDSPDAFYDTWLKSVTRPELSRRVLLTKDNIPEFEYADDNAFDYPQGGEYPVGSIGTHRAPTTTLTAYTSTEDEEDDMRALLKSGILLFQTRPEYHVADFYLAVGSFTMALTGAGTASVSRRWTIPVTVVARPATLEDPMVIPGEGYQDMQETSYAQVGVLWGSYGAMTESTAL